MLDCSRLCAPVVVDVSVNHMLRSDAAGVVHIGKDDLDIGAGDQGILVGYAVEETGDTNVSCLMIRFGAATETAILYELKLGAVVIALRTSGFVVDTVQLWASEARSRSTHCDVISTRILEV